MEKQTLGVALTIAQAIGDILVRQRKRRARHIRSTYVVYFCNVNGQKSHGKPAVDAVHRQPDIDVISAPATSSQ